MTETESMQLAIARCREGIAAGQSPFGAAVIRDGQLIVAPDGVVCRDET